jgi:hypothetical protein
MLFLKVIEEKRNEHVEYMLELHLVLISGKQENEAKTY